MNLASEKSAPLDRLGSTFQGLKSNDRAALVTFIMGGDPDPSTFAALFAGLPEAGADIIEIGMPFSDPMADGPVIQAAGKRSLDSGTTLKSVLRAVTEFRRSNQHTPVVLMGYFNPIYRYGCSEFADAASSAGVDGLIIVDLPPEEDAELRAFTDPAGIHWIRLIAPTTDHQRRARLLNGASGFVYCVSITGITGTRSANSVDLETMIGQVRSLTSIPLAIGFGIRTSQQAAEASRLADAVVVGTALVERVADALGSGEVVDIDPALEYVRALKTAMR